MHLLSVKIFQFLCFRQNLLKSFMQRITVHAVEIALQYATKKKDNRLKQNKVYRRLARSRRSLSASLCDTLFIEESMPNEIAPQTLSLLDDQVSGKADMTPTLSLIRLKEEIIKNDEIESTYSTGENSSFDDMIFSQDISDLSLHPYTTQGCLSFTKELISFIRKANISKRHADFLIRLIHSSLPQPNTCPKTYCGLLNLLSGTAIHFALFLSIS